MRQVAIGFGVAIPLLCSFVAPRAAEQLPAGTAELRFAGNEVRLALVPAGGRLLVQVQVGEAGPHGFLIDTGSTVSVIDSTIATALELEVVGTQPVGAPGGQSVEANVVVVPALRTGGLTIDDVQMVALELKEMTGGVIEGVLGMDLFTDVLLSLDASGEVATISRDVLERTDPHVVALDAMSGGINFMMDVAGTDVETHLDTGSPGGITLPIDLMDELPLVAGPGRRGRAGLVGGSRSLVARQLDGIVRVGTLEYRDPPVSFMDPSAPYGNLGSAVANELVITIDQRSKLISLRRSDTAPGAAAEDAAPQPPRRLGVRFGGAGSSSLDSVASVDSGSLGERAGFKAGDVIIQLNGRSMSEYDVAALGALIRSVAPLTWEIDRNGERITIVVR